MNDPLTKFYVVGQRHADRITATLARASSIGHIILRDYDRNLSTFTLGASKPLFKYDSNLESYVPNNDDFRPWFDVLFRNGFRFVKSVN
jgi:hypothetical protein